MDQHLLQQLRMLRDEFAHRHTISDSEESFAQRIEQSGIRIPVSEVQEAAAELFRGLAGPGEHFVPPVLLTVIRELLKGATASLVVDPWAGVGVLAATVFECCNAKRAIAYATRSGTLELGKALTPQLDWRLARIVNPLSPLEQLGDEIDLAVCIPPMGVRSPQPLRVGLPGGPEIETRDVGQAMLIASALKLSANGRALFVLPSVALLNQGSVLPNISSLGLSVHAALELPVGSFAPFANLSAYLVVVQKKANAETFVARLSDDRRANDQIIENLREKRSGGAIELGRLVALSSFRGIDDLKLKERLRAAEKTSGIQSAILGEIAVGIELGRSTAGYSFSNVDNAVYIPLIGSSDVVTSAGDLTLKPQNYAQILIDASRSDARFVAKFFNSELGREIRETHKSGGVIARLNISGLKGMQVFLPPVGTQHRVLDVAARISAESNIVRNLEIELSELSRDLWTSPNQADSIDSKLRYFSVRLQGGVATHAAESLDRWVESLPFPLASILRAWQATGSREFKAKQDHLLHFFEAMAEFLSVILLSGFASRPELFAGHKEKVNDVWSKQHLTLSRPTFGTWKVTVEYLGKQVRRLMDGDRQERTLCQDLFADESLTLSAMLANKELLAVVSAANKMRNDWSGHGGVVGESEARLRAEQLVAELAKLRDAMADTWSQVELVRALDRRPKRGMFENEIAVLMGSNSEFLKESRMMSHWLDVERIYLMSRHSKRALPLFPLLHIGPSPASAKNACYFFNRVDKDGIRFVSYHFVDQPERKEAFEDVAETIRLLTEAPLASPAN